MYFLSCMYRCVSFSFKTMRKWALISLKSQLVAAAPEFSFPLSDKPVSQSALFQILASRTLSHCSSPLCCTVVLSGIYTAAPTGVPPAADTDCRLAQPVTPETVYSPTPVGRLSKPRN